MFLVGAFWIGVPFFSERLAVGQWRLLFSISMLPWLYLAATSTYLKSWWMRLAPIALIAFLMISHYRRSVNFLELIAIAAILSWIITGTYLTRSKRLIAGLVAMVAVIVVAAWGGAHFAGSLRDLVSADQLSLFTVGHGPFVERLLGAVSYIGFWAERADRLPVNFAAYWFYYLPGLALLPATIVGWRELYRSRPFEGVLLPLIYGLSLIIVLSNYPIFDSHRLLAFYDSIGFTGLRETGKFMGLMMVTQVIGLGAALGNTNKLKSGLAILAIAFLLPATSGLFRLAVTPTPYPASLVETAQSANIKNEKTIMLPWHRFQAYPFTHGKVVDQLAPSLFEKTVFNEMFEFNGITTLSADPWQRQMADATNEPTIADERLLGLFKEKDIQLVVIMKTNDYQKYLDWASRIGLEKVRDDADLTAYRL